MKFYKMINGENFVGIGTSLDLRRFQLKHKIILVCDESKAQYIQYKDDLYRASWMVPVNNDIANYTLLDVIEIDKDEYTALQEAIDIGEDIEVSAEPEVVVEEVIELLPEEKVTIDYVKGLKLKEMSNQCNKIITAGFNVVLSDGEAHHFDLTLEDQLNLFDAAASIEKGEEAIPYHASGEICKFYSAEDMKLIIDAASNLKKYHTTYFNSLKGYINSLMEVESVVAVVYGEAIPDEYMSEVLKSLL